MNSVCGCACHDVSVLSDSQADRKLMGITASSLQCCYFSEDVCVLRSIPKITSLNHQPPMMALFSLSFFFLLPCAGNIMCTSVCSTYNLLCFSIFLCCFSICFLGVSVRLYSVLGSYLYTKSLCSIGVAHDCYPPFSFWFVILSTYNETECTHARSSHPFTLWPTETWQGISSYDAFLQHHPISEAVEKDCCLFKKWIFL